MPTVTLFLSVLLSLIGCDKDGDTDDTGNTDAVDVVLATGFGEESVAGRSEGTESSTTCGGLYPASPQHQMNLENTFTEMGVTADSADVVLMISFAQSTFCSDDDSGAAAVVRGSWSAGAYSVFVGVSDGGTPVDHTFTAVEVWEE